MSAPLPIVLVHGAWHGAWCWSALQAELDRRGVPSFAIDLPGHGISTLPLGDLHTDAQHVAECVDALARDVVLVGHSYGGAVITEAATRCTTGHVRHLVYLAAFVPDAGESLRSMLEEMPPADTLLGEAMQVREDGTAVVEPEGAVPALYGSCAREVAEAAIARLCPQPLVTFAQPLDAAAWRDIPTLYVRCTQDQAIHIEHQTLMASRCSDVRTLDTDHSPFASAVGPTADLLEDVARRDPSIVGS